MSYTLALKSVYDFVLKAPSVLGSGFKKATVMGLLDFDSASAIEDVRAIHTSIYNQLGVGVPRLAADLTYVKIKTSAGEVRVIAMDWIAEQPVLFTSQPIQIVLTGESLSEIPTLRQVLKAAGYNSFEINALPTP